MDSALHWMDQLGTKLPLMRASIGWRRTERWLSTQSLAVVATARNAMPGLDTTISNLLRLCGKFARCSLRLHQLTSDLRLLQHQPGLRHPPRLRAHQLAGALPPERILLYWQTAPTRPRLKRSLLEELERVQLMSALRNQLLAFAYSRLAANHSLLLPWTRICTGPTGTWPILQGLYFFHARPRLDS
uniref:DHC_N2 domain-containing protein n=1 Tax=Macrostomum lignano TaxID=282301 RepID=A0A1I8FN47_9PLAT